MVVTRLQSHILKNQFNNLYINKQVHMVAPVLKYFLSPFEGNIHYGDPQVLKLYLRSTKGMYK